MTQPELTVIVAMGRNREIGRAGDLAFHISADLRRFKQLTMGGTLIMGRKTFESLPNGPLPGRRNIVLSRKMPREGDAPLMNAATENAARENAATEMPREGDVGTCLWHVASASRHPSADAHSPLTPLKRATGTSVRPPQSPQPREGADGTSLHYEPCLEAAIENWGGSDSKLFIIGGGQIYAQALPLATRLELTLIDADLSDADTFFPEIGPEWVVETATERETDPRTGLTYRFLTYRKQA